MMARRWVGERGSVTAEFALVLPAVVLVLLLCAGTLISSARQVRLEQGAAQAARLAGRAESADRIAGALAQAVTGASGRVMDRGDLVCVEATAPAGLPVPLPPLHATSCALAGGL